jgi:hypothetical protein
MTYLRLALTVFGATIAGVATLAAIVVTTGRALPWHFPRGADACFGRVYGDAFLAAHPEHHVSEVYVYRTLSPGLLNADERPRAQQVAADRASRAELSVTVLARFRDKPGAVDRDVICESDGIAGATCYADCDGAMFSVYPDGRGIVLDRSGSTSFVSLSGIHAGARAGVRLYLAKDGVDYRLDPLPIATCLAAYENRERSQVPPSSRAGK